MSSVGRISAVAPAWDYNPGSRALAQDKSDNLQSVSEVNTNDAAEKDTASEVKGSLSGYTENQVEALYLQGRISRIDYNSEIDRRDRIKEQLSEDETEAVEENKPAAVEELEDFKIENTEAEDEKKTTDATDEEKAEAQEKSSVQDTMDRDSEFAKELGGVVAQLEDVSLKADGIMSAIANDRTEIMNQIYGDDSDKKIGISSL